MGTRPPSVELRFDHVASPIGVVTLVVKDGALCALEFGSGGPPATLPFARRFGPVTLRRARDPNRFSTRVREYFAGALDTIVDIPIDVDGSAFDRGVWAEMRKIPAGATASYGDIARAVGRPRAARAVGIAAARNPVALVIPCHRVIGANGALTGYAGGLARKRWLLAHEGVSV